MPAKKRRLIVCKFINWPKTAVSLTAWAQNKYLATVSNQTKRPLYFRGKITLNDAI